MIYFMQPVEGGPIKVGSSENIEARRKQLETHYGRSLSVLATIPGGRKEERKIHERFSHLRLGRTEQFRPAPDLMEFIGRPLLVHPNPNAVEALPCAQGVPVRLEFDEDILAIARMVAAARGISLSRYIEDSMRSVVRKDMEREFRKRLRKR